MPDLKAPCLQRARGERLTLAEYDHDFDERYARILGRDSWKLERLQHFEEHDNPSREALRRGDWDEACRLLEQRRDGLREAAEQDRRQRTVFHRVRVVEKPFTAYLQWELHSLRIKTEYDEVVRVVDADRLELPESDAPLPEIVLLGGETLYEVIYTDAGVLDGAVRFTDPELVKAWEDFVRGLYDKGEDIRSYFEREVAPLPPPRLTRP